MIDRKCTRHKDLKTRPRLCTVCQRLAVERDIVTKLVDEALAKGYYLRVDDGESNHPRSNDRAVILEQLGEVDDEAIIVMRPKNEDEEGKPFKLLGWVKLVYGNDGFDVVSDYSANPVIETLLEPVNKLADTFEK